MKTKKQQHKLPCSREDSWGPLLYSSAEQTEHLCSSFPSSPKQLCQKLKFAFLTLFILRGKLFLQRVKTFLPSSSVVLVWILKKKRLMLVSPLLNKPSTGNSLLPQQLWPHLSHKWKQRWKKIVLTLHLSFLVTRLQAASGKHKFLQNGLTWGKLKKFPVSLGYKNILWIIALALWKTIRKIKNLCQFSKITDYVFNLRARAFGNLF